MPLVSSDWLFLATFLNVSYTQFSCESSSIGTCKRGQWRCSLYAGLQQPESTAVLPAGRHPTSSTYLRAAKWDRIQSLGYVLRVNWSIKSWLFYLSLRVLSLRLAGLSAGARPLRPSSRRLHCARALTLRPGPRPHREPPQVVCSTSLISVSLLFFSFFTRRLQKR